MTDWTPERHAAEGDMGWGVSEPIMRYGYFEEDPEGQDTGAYMDDCDDGEYVLWVDHARAVAEAFKRGQESMRERAIKLANDSGDEGMELADPIRMLPLLMTGVVLRTRGVS